MFTLMAAGWSSFAQSLAQHHWYFGTTVNGVQFNRATNIPQLVTDQHILAGTGGSAVATDPSNANLLFYSDGVNVYNACHIQMPNGFGLSGNPSGNQPVVFCPVPGQPDKYFLFTNSANYTTGGSIAWSVVDMKLYGTEVFPTPPLGNVDITAVAKNNTIATLTGRSEGMTIIPHSNGTDYWLITHKNSSQDYYATKIDAASYPSGTFVTTITSGLGVPTSVANFAYNHRNKKMAVSAQDTKTDAIILNFDTSTGQFTFDRTIFNSGMPTVTNQSIYDIEWDNKGQYLYISRAGEAGINADVLQYDYKNPGNTLLSVLGGASIFRSWGLIFAPDSTIYHLYQDVTGGPYLMENFKQTNHRADSVIRTPLPFGNVDFGGMQFPSFNNNSNPNLTVSFTTIGSCQNNPTSFFPTVSPNADSLHWDFGDNRKVTEWSPVHTYATASAFNVTLTAYYQGQKKTVTQPVTINAMTLKIQLVSDTTACRSEFPPPRGSSSPKQFSVKVKVTQGSAGTYTWSNGQTGATLKPDSAGYYYVVVTDASAPGCSAYAGVNVKEYKLQDQRSNVWYFGNKAGIDFNKRPPKALSNSIMDAPAGCAIICDRNGQTIFYTDGNNVYGYNVATKTSSLIDTGIGGDPNSSQAAIIIPVPGDETLYYIFTTQAINGTSANELRYSLFDLKQGTHGLVVQKNILLFSKSSEHLTANSQWLIAHEYGNNTFRAYRVTATGIADPIYSSIGSVESFKDAVNGQGYMKLGPKNNLAVAFSTPGTSNWVELFTFVDTTGVITNYRKIDLKQPAGQVYGVEFSPGGNKLFATIKDTPNSTVFEYFIDSIGKPYLRSNPPTTLAAELGALQLAPDGQIYMAVNGSTTLGTIQANEDTTKVSTINLSGFALAGGTNSRLGLPNLIQQNGSGFGGPGFTFTGICLGDSTKFVGTPTDAIDKFQWFFGDGAGSTQPAPAHLYAAAGTYTVSMRLTNRCGLDTTIIQKVKIFPPPAKPSIPIAAVLCTGAVTLDANTPNTAGLTYSWSTGATTKTLTVTQPFIVNVTNTDVNGCSSKAQSIVVDNRPQVNLGADITVCQNNAVSSLDAQNPGANYVWTIDGVAASTTQFQAVSTTTPRATPYLYKVVVTDPVTTCTVTAQKNITVNVSPSFTFTGVNPSGCNVSDGKITLTLSTTTPASGPYSYFLSGPGFSQNAVDQAAPKTIGPLGGKAAGTYSAIVTDQITGCTISQAVGLTNNSFTITPTTTAACDPPKINVSTTVVSFPLQYTVTNGATGQVVSGNSASANFAVQLLSQGIGTTVTYTIQVSDNGGCVTTKTHVVTTTNPTPLTITPSLCTNPATLTAAGGSSYTWTGPGISGGSSGAAINILTGGTYTVSGLSGGCTVTQSTTFNFNGPISPNFTFNPCQLPVIVSATPTGNFTYQWSNSGGPVAGGSTITAAATDTYTLVIKDTQTGCSTPPFTKQVDVVGPVTASVTASLACDDNKAFTLTAATNAASPTFVWTLNGTTISGATGNPLSQTAAGTYGVIVNQSGGAITCSSPEATIQIVKAPIPKGQLPAATTICNSPDNADPTTKTVDLDPGIFVSYDWFKNDVSLAYTSRVYTANSEGKYRVDLTNTYGCTNSNLINVVNDCEPLVSAPNAFRPGSHEAKNKDFYIFSFFITDNFEVVIFNRWGEPVFESKDKNFKWNGGYNNNTGQPLPGGTYAYVLRYVSSFHPDQGVLEQRGGVVLLR
jgi:gliding motility-associated-like protein